MNVCSFQKKLVKEYRQVCCYPLSLTRMFLPLPPSLSQAKPPALATRHVYFPREVIAGSAGILLHVASG